MCHWLNPAQLLQSRLTSPRLLPSFSNSAFTKSSIRVCLMLKPISWRSHATSHEPHTFFIQPLDPSCRSQSIRRGFIISLPILIIYLLLYLLGFVLHRTELGRQHLDTVARFWKYTRQEDLQNVAGLCTFVTSQFTHRGLAPLVMDSLVLVGIASVLGSVFNRRTFFAVYVLGGFLAAAADCAWARVTNPCRSLTQAQHDEILTTVRVIDEAAAKFNELRSSLQLFTWKAFVKFWTNPREFFEKLAKDPVHKESKRQLEIINEQYPIVRDWVRWNERNWASSGSLICLMSVATMIRPRTIVNLWGVRPKLYKLTAWFFAYSVYMHLNTNSRSNFSACLGGNLAAVPLWLLWLRKGRIGALASGLRAFDQLNKPARSSPQALLGLLVWVIISTNLFALLIEKRKKQKAEDAKETKESDPQQHSDEEGNNPSGVPEKDAASGDKTQEDTPASQPAAENNDQTPGKDKD